MTSGTCNGELQDSFATSYLNRTNIVYSALLPGSVNTELGVKAIYGVKTCQRSSVTQLTGIAMYWRPPGRPHVAPHRCVGCGVLHKQINKSNIDEGWQSLLF